MQAVHDRFIDRPQGKVAIVLGAAGRDHSGRHIARRFAAIFERV